MERQQGAVPPPSPPVWHALVAGSASAVVSRLVTYPPDTVKARLQVQGSGGAAVLYSSTLHAFRRIAATEGLPGFYRGFGGILLTVIPANCLYFSGYELGRRLTAAGAFSPSTGAGAAATAAAGASPLAHGLLGDLATALVAQTVAGLAFCPIDIVKQRVQTHAVLQHPVGGVSSSGSISSSAVARMGPVAAVQEVYAAAGLRGFYKGWVAMTALWMPWNVVYMCLYEGGKRRWYTWELRRLRQQRRRAGSPAAATAAATAAAATALIEIAAAGEVRVLADPPLHAVLPLWSFPLCSALASAAASVATHPIDVVKTRLQVLSNRGPTSPLGGGGGGAGGGGGGGPQLQQPQRQLTAWQVCRQLYAEEGLRGFGRGMGARIATMSAGSAVTWLTYESVKRWLAVEGRGGQQRPEDG